MVFPGLELDKSVWCHNYLYDFVNNCEAIVDAMVALCLVHFGKRHTNRECVYPPVLSSEQLHFIWQLLEFDFNLIAFAMLMIY